MRFLHGKVKAHTGDKVTVSISTPTRVLIMPEREFKKYKNHVTFTYFGGQKDGEYVFVVPKSGTWIVVVEKGSYNNPLNIEVSIKKEAGEPVDNKRRNKKKKKKEIGSAMEALDEAATDANEIPDEKVEE